MEPELWNDKQGTRRPGVEIPGQRHTIQLAKDLSKGDDGFPRGERGRPPVGHVDAEHFHDSPQFQVLLEGTVSFPTHELTGPAVHYADAFAQYGPFTIGQDPR
jgi:hypothetical protein